MSSGGGCSSAQRVAGPFAMANEHQKWVGCMTFFKISKTDTSKIICKVCNNILSRGGKEDETFNTINLKTHLKSKHKVAMRRRPYKREKWKGKNKRMFESSYYFESSKSSKDAPSISAIKEESERAENKRMFECSYYFESSKLSKDAPSTSAISQSTSRRRENQITL